jgi:hypothetical protein
MFMLIWIIFFVMLFTMIGAAPAWPHSRSWGYRPSGIITSLLIIFLFLWMFGCFSTWGHHGWWGGDHMQGQSMMHQ